jgi:hypothetical protein
MGKKAGQDHAIAIPEYEEQHKADAVEVKGFDLQILSQANDLTVSITADKPLVTHVGPVHPP